MKTSLIDVFSSVILDGARLTVDQGLELAQLGPEHTTSLLCAAGRIKKHFGLPVFTCSITNAKSGQCTQDCVFCAQSAHHQANSPEHPLLPVEQMIERGLAMYRAGARCHALVTSGLMLTSEEINQICACLRVLRQSTNLELSASLGLLTTDYCSRLKAAGLMRYHHNLETARSFFPQICTTHAYDQDIATIKRAQDQGLTVCSGGILGLGESFAQRIELAATLADLGVSTVPLNFLVPIPGTPLEHSTLLTPHDALKSVALFRFMLPTAHITIAGGRELVLGDYQSWLPLAGANGLMIGNYLTTDGRDLDQDRLMLEQGQWI